MEKRDTIRNFVEENMIIYDDSISFTDTDNIFELGFVDSMFALKLVTFIESEFSLKVENDDLNLQNFSSIANIIKFIDGKQVD